MKYTEYIKLLEDNKDRFFDKNENLSDTEKEYYKKFFKDHSSADKQIKNWNFKLSKEDFDKAIYNFDNNSSKLPTETMDDLEEGVDFEYLGDIEKFSYRVYFIYTHKASYTIASNNVGQPVWSPLPSWYNQQNYKDDYIYIRQKGIYSGAKWCTAMHHDDYYFNNFLEDGYCFLYCVSTDTNIKMPLCKLAVTIEKSDCYVENVYDSLDNICNDSNINKSIYAFVKDNEETIKNCIKELGDSGIWEDDDSDFNPNSEYVINPLRHYLSDIFLRQSQYEDVNAFLSYSEDPVNLFLFRYENKYIGMTNRDVIAEGKQFIDEYTDLVQLARLSGTKYDMLNKLFGSNGYKTENNCFIIKDFLTTKTYCTGSSKQSYLLLDFLSCIVNKINGSYEFFFDENSRRYVTYLINKLFDTMGLLEDLSNCIKSYNKESEVFKNTITKKNPGIGVSTFKVDETHYNFTDIVDLMLNIARDFDNEANKHSDILQMYSSIIDKESLLNSFFVKIALILLNHVCLNESTADTWFDVICSKDGYENSYTTMEESSPTVKLIVQYNNYYFNRSKLDTIYNVSTIGNYA